MIQTDEAEREISKGQVFCYIYQYKGPKPIEEERRKREKLAEARKRDEEKQKTELNQRMADTVEAIRRDFPEEKQSKPQISTESKKELDTRTLAHPRTFPPQRTMPSAKPIGRVELFHSTYVNVKYFSQCFGKVISQ